MEIETQPVTEHDRSTFEQMYTDYLAEGQPDSPHPPEGWIENVFSQALAGERCLWFAKAGAETIGFVDFKIMPFFSGSSDTYAFIHDFYIVQSQRRCGFGKMLANCVVIEAQRQGVSSIELNVAPHNQHAMQFWQSIGFKLRHYSLEMITNAV